MAKLRKMLGDIQSEECIALMRLMETQSKRTLSEWAVDFAESSYLPILEAEISDADPFVQAIAMCRNYWEGSTAAKDVKAAVRQVTQLARELEENPIGQAAARAVATACAAWQTPTSALGFLFYGAAAAAYHHAGLDEKIEIYQALAQEELQRALESLRQAAILDEPNPAKIEWNC
ncbi:MAG: putative immunity protein [Candidatus Merdivicinus sp.]|jgi:hypothetical protein